MKPLTVVLALLASIGFAGSATADLPAPTEPSSGAAGGQGIAAGAADPSAEDGLGRAESASSQGQASSDDAEGPDGNGGDGGDLPAPTSQASSGDGDEASK